jgi:hypothetical protein
MGFRACARRGCSRRKTFDFTWPSIFSPGSAHGQGQPVADAAKKNVQAVIGQALWAAQRLAKPGVLQF